MRCDATRREIKKAVAYGIVVIYAVLVSITNGTAVFATGSWTSGTFTFGSEGPSEQPASQCTMRTATLGSGLNAITRPFCIYDRPHWRYAIYGYYQYNHYYSGVAVGVGSDSHLYKVDGLSASSPILEVPGSDDIIFNNWMANMTNNHQITIVHDLPSRLTSSTDITGNTTYQVQSSGYESLIPDSLGNPVYTGAVGVSPNGRWLAIEVMSLGFVLYDTHSGHMQLFSNHKHQYGVGSDIHITFAVSNDGNYVSAFAGGFTPRVYSLSSTCIISGSSYDALVANSGAAFQSCPDDDGRLLAAINTHYGSLNNLAGFPTEFSDENDALIIPREVTQMDDSILVYKTPLRAGNYVESAHLDYLAMGDSISSGEGDTQKNPVTNQKSYRAHTDVEENTTANQPREKCHLSTRSYPYLTASWMMLTRDAPKQWDSVACSNAGAYDISGDKFDYAGQAKGAPKPWSSDGNVARLEGYSNKDNLQSTALNEMIPGRVEQIKFVENYKPKVITLTAAANDIDFAGKLQNCVLSIPSCDWAISKKANLAKQMENEYDGLVDLYKQLYEASGSKARIYIIGYPQIINGSTNADCKGRVGLLDGTEREMITSATSYLNEVIEHAANAAGVTYLDVSHALDGNRLCEGSSTYMNGITDFVGWEDSANIYLERQESFHPNDFGHIKITQALKQAVDNQSLLTYDVCPDTLDPNDVNCPKTGTDAEKPPITDFSGVTQPPATNSQSKHIVASAVTKNTTVNISSDKYDFKPGSSLTVTLHSDPIDLGTYTATSNGSLTDTVTIPSTAPVGYHTLIVTGQSYSGEPIEFTQSILVTGANQNDLDHNGVLDTQQPCGAFVQASGQDTDYDGIDDACDPHVTDPILYIARNGDTAKGEDTTKLYLYRNTRASALTGVTTDYVDTSLDPNNKEALIATSLDTLTQATYNKLIMVTDPQDSTKQIPTILAKDTTTQCIALQPTDYLSPSLNPTDPSYHLRGFTKLAQLPEGEECE